MQNNAFISVRFSVPLCISSVRALISCTSVASEDLQAPRIARGRCRWHKSRPFDGIQRTRPSTTQWRPRGPADRQRLKRPQLAGFPISRFESQEPGKRSVCLQGGLRGRLAEGGRHELAVRGAVFDQTERSVCCGMMRRLGASLHRFMIGH